MTADWKVLSSSWLDLDLALTGKMNACWVSRATGSARGRQNPCVGQALANCPLRETQVPVCACLRTEGVPGRRSPPAYQVALEDSWEEGNQGAP